MKTATFEITLPKYQGPFDLLLAAIRDGSIDIFEISLANITIAYFEYLKKVELVDLDSAADFIAMAAYLVEMKSKKLLPQPEVIEIVAEEEQLEADLLKHLNEYQVFKQAAAQLKEKKTAFARIYSRYHREVLGPEEKEIFLTDVNLTDLVSAFQRAYLTFAAEEEVRGIPDEEITLEGRIKEVVEIIRAGQGEIEFEKLFIRRTRLEAVVTFLAILELARQQMIAILQGEGFGAIYLRLIQN